MNYYKLKIIIKLYLLFIIIKINKIIKYFIRGIIIINYKIKYGTKPKPSSF